MRGLCLPVQRVRGWGRGHQGHCHCHKAGDGPEDEAEVEIVDLTHNVVPPLGRLRGVVVTTGGHRGGELQPEPDQRCHELFEYSKQILIVGTK